MGCWKVSLFPRPRPRPRHPRAASQAALALAVIDRFRRSQRRCQRDNPNLSTPAGGEFAFLEFPNKKSMGMAIALEIRSPRGT